MRNGFGISQRSILFGLCSIFILVFLIKATPAEKNIRKGEEASVTFQSVDNHPTTSSTPILTSTTFPRPTIGLQTQIPQSTSNSVCATIWGNKPPQILPGWLTTPPNADGLYSEVKYVFLAGHLISEGIVDSGDCPNGGLTPDGVANSCGMEKAYTKVIFWQNQFDQYIYSAAQVNQISAVMLKRLFAQETQFWPPNSIAPRAYGIGNVRSPGIEPLFLWNYEIFQNTCHDVYSQSCSQPYSKLPLENQQILRGYFISHYIDAYCATCLNSIDLDKIKRSIDFFAKLIVANCFQVNQILNNNGFSSPTLSYEDAWRLTLANYTVGPTCINNGIQQMDVSKGFYWEDFDNSLGSNCNADIYINTITR
jgi:hypothetical protein